MLFKDKKDITMNKKTFIKIASALLFNAIVGGIIATLLGCSPMGGAVVACLIAIALPGFMPEDAACDGVLTEVWTGELIKALRGKLDAAWLNGVPDQSSIVNNDVIHLVDVGADPQVLVNNTTYPLDVQDLEDGDKTFSLDKFQTKVVPVTDDELYALSYDKMARVKESCANALNSTAGDLARKAGAELSDASLTAAMDLIVSGRADATVNNVAAVEEYMKERPDMNVKIAAIYEPEEGEEWIIQSAVAFQKGADTLTEKVNEILQEMIDDGTCYDLTVQYFGQSVADSTSIYQK